MRHFVPGLVGILAFTALGSFGGCTSPSYQARQRSQRNWANTLAPAPLASDRPRHAPTTAVPFRIRAYADQDYRATTLRWKDKVEEQLERANELVGPELGVRFELIDAQPWERAGPAEMEAAYRELEALDPGKDVDAVLGLIGPLPRVTQSLTLLGLARPLSRHLLVRGMNDAAEHDAIVRAFDTLAEEEREQLYRKRKAHKETLVIVHEWAHSLGALHTRDNYIMSPSYDPKQHAFSAPTRKILELGLRYRRGEAGDETAYQRELARILETEDPAWWVEGEREQLLAMLGQQPAGEPTAAPGEAVADPRSGLTREETETFNRAVSQARGQRWEEAWRTLRPLLDTHPDDPALQTFGCRLAAERPDPPSLALAKAQCERAAALQPDDATPLLSLAGAHLRRGERDAAQEHTRRAEAALAGRADGGAPAKWHEVAVVYQHLQAVSLAEAAAKRAQDSAVGRGVLVWAHRMRRRYGLPPDGARFGAPPEREGAYFTLVREAFDTIGAGEVAKAKRMARAGLRRFRDAPGLLSVLCDLELRAGRPRAAEPLCARALAGWDEAAWAHYLTGVVAVQRSDLPRAIRHLERAVGLDPESRSPYEQLARAYRQAGDRDGMTRTRQRYRTQFGVDLPR